MSALTLLKLVPRKWKELVQRDRPVAFDEQSEITSQLLAATKVTRWAYSQLSKTDCMPDKAIVKWERDLVIPRNFSWEKVFREIYVTTDDISLRCLQFRIIHRLIPTNKRLKLFGITQTDRCQHCPLAKEDLIHLFWSCSKVKKLWENLARACQCSQFDGIQVLLNTPEGSSDFK